MNKNFFDNKPVVLRSQNGSSVAGILVASAIALSVIGTVFMAIGNIQKVLIGTEQDANFVSLVKDIDLFTASSKTCTKYLADQKIDKELKIEDSDVDIKIAAGEIYRGWKIKSLKIESIAPPPSPRMATIHLVGQRIGQNIGVPEKHEKFLIQVNDDPDDPNLIVSCEGHLGTGSTGGGGETPPEPPSEALLCGNKSSYKYPGAWGGGVTHKYGSFDECESWGVGLCGSSLSVNCPKGYKKYQTYTKEMPGECFEYVCVKEESQ